MSDLSLVEALQPVIPVESASKTIPDKIITEESLSVDNTKVEGDVDNIKVKGDVDNIKVEGDVDNIKVEGDVEEDPYAYLESGQFSSENFKIEIKNLPRHYGIKEFRKLLNEKLKLSSNKLKTPRINSPYAFVCFRNDEDRDKAIAILNDYSWKGNKLTAYKAKANPDPLVKKRKDDRDSQGANKKSKHELKSIEERLKDSTIPCWFVPYEKQLEQKQEQVRKVLRKLGNDLAFSNSNLKKWVEKQKELYDGLPCELMEIRSAKQIDGYRNKCEFSVGINEETGLKTVGFRIGSYVNGITGVGPIQHLVHIPERMKIVAKIFEEFVRNSKLEVFNPELHSGHFKQVTVRTSRTELMVIVGIHPQNLTEEEIKQFQDELVQFFYEGDGKIANVTSLYYLPITKRISGQNATVAKHLHGETFIHETLLDLYFRISPEAFFQINTEGAELLYNAAIELAKPTEKSTVLDICCGTGTIGLCFAKHCGQVLGLEIVPQAIIDAQENAKVNHIENSEFFAGKAEDILSSVIYRAKHDDIIAIVDPPRAGLHHRAITHLRKFQKLTKLVYISCNPEAALKNFVDLGRAASKTMHGAPFIPVKAVVIDMFPYTHHCELVILFERFEGEIEVKNEENVKE